MKIEKYPENMPWDSEINLNQNLNVEWMLTKSDDVYVFSRSRINNEFVYIQKNEGKKKAFSEYSARFTYQRLFDQGYELALVA